MVHYFFFGWFWIKYWIHSVLFFRWQGGNFRKFLCLHLLFMMCPRLPNLQFGSGAKWACLKWFFLSRISSVAKVEKINWEVAFKCNPNFKINKFLHWRKQGQDLYAFMTKAWLFHTSVMFETLHKFKASQQRDYYSSSAVLKNSFNGILFEISGIHKADSWDFGLQKFIYVLLITYR